MDGWMHGWMDYKNIMGCAFGRVSQWRRRLYGRHGKRCTTCTAAICGHTAPVYLPTTRCPL